MFLCFFRLNCPQIIFNCASPKTVQCLHQMKFFIFSLIFLVSLIRKLLDCIWLDFILNWELLYRFALFCNVAFDSFGIGLWSWVPCACAKVNSYFRTKLHVVAAKGLWNNTPDIQKQLNGHNCYDMMMMITICTMTAHNNDNCLELWCEQREVIPCHNGLS